MPPLSNLLTKPEAMDQHKLWTLMAALLVLFLAYPLVVGLDLLRFYRLALSAVLIFAAYSVSGNRRVLKIAIVLGAPAILAQVVATSITPTPVVILVVVVLSIGFILFISLIIFASTFRDGDITGDRIAGAICVYLLAGLLWAMLYGTVLAFDPAAFELSSGVDIRQMYREGMEFSFLYFSFVTMTTVGYGDVLPLSPLAQTLAWLEAVFGQLYIAILLARLVSLHVARTNREGDRS